MPSKNTIREYDVPAYCHVYNRGAGGASVYATSVGIGTASIYSCQG
ncbi:MAG: hypothetical protein WA087_00540 [Candidatus Saccharimonadales bacterium]